MFDIGAKRLLILLWGSLLYLWYETDPLPILLLVVVVVVVAGVVVVVVVVE